MAAMTTEGLPFGRAGPRTLVVAKKGLLAGGLLLATIWVGMVVSYLLFTPQATVVNDLSRTIWILSCQDNGVVIDPGETATLRPVYPCLVFDRENRSYLGCLPFTENGRAGRTPALASDLVAGVSQRECIGSADYHGGGLLSFLPSP